MKKLFIKKKVFSLGGKFTVTDEHQRDKYFIEGSIMSIPKNFTIRDREGVVIGKITKKTFSFLPKFFVEVNGKEIMTIKKEWTFFKSRYQIDTEGLAVTGDWWDKTFSVTRGQKPVATVNEKWFTWGDTYEIDIFETEFEQAVIALVVAVNFVKQEEAAASSGAAT